MLFSRGGKLVDLEKRLSTAKADLDAARAKLAAITAAGNAASETYISYAKWRSECDEAMIEVGRLEKFIAGFEQEVAEIRRIDGLAAIQKRAAAARKSNAALAERVRVEGAKLSMQLLALIAEVAASEAEADEINRQLPDGDEHVVNADVLARGRGGLIPREVISESTESLWVYERTGALIGDQDRVQASDGGKGFLPASSTDPFEGGHSCVRRKFKVTKFHPAQHRVTTDSLYRVVQLPRFDGAGNLIGRYWRSSAQHFAEAAGEAASASARPPAPQLRDVETEMTPLEPWGRPASAPVGYRPDRNVTPAVV